MPYRGSGAARCRCERCGSRRRGAARRDPGPCQSRRGPATGRAVAAGGPRCRACRPVLPFVVEPRSAMTRTVILIAPPTPIHERDHHERPRPRRAPRPQHDPRSSPDMTAAQAWYTACSASSRTTSCPRPGAPALRRVPHRRHKARTGDHRPPLRAVAQVDGRADHLRRRRRAPLHAPARARRDGARARDGTRPGFVTASVVDPFGGVLEVMFNRHYLDVLEAQNGRGQIEVNVSRPPGEGGDRAARSASRTPRRSCAPRRPGRPGRRGRDPCA